MSRRHSAEKREINPDPKYGNLVVSKFMNVIMRAGKKSVAENIVYGALDLIEGKTKQNPVSVFEQALENVMPSIEVRSRRVGVDPSADATLLRALLQRRHLLLRVLRDSRVADQLVDGRHRLACSPSLSVRGADEERFIPTRITEERLALTVRLALTRFTEDHPARARRSCTSHLTDVRGSV